MSTSKIKMVELDEDILSNLKCSECDEYLSFPPIMVKQDGESICGRCTLDEEEAETAVRDKSYEQLAAIVLFPCKYESEGCTEKSTLTDTEEHEGCCPFRKMPCMAKGGDGCLWVGTYDMLLAHFEDKHVDLVVEHPSTAKPDLTEKGDTNWLMSAFGFLFLVQIKFKESTDELWHSVHFIGDYKLSSKFSYNFEIGNGKTAIKEDRKVMSMAQYDDDFTKESSKGLMKFLGDYENITFNVRLIINETTCPLCNETFTSVIYQRNDGFCCDICKISTSDNDKSEKETIIALPCPNLGCTYIAQDDSSLRKHYKWLCSRTRNKCVSCGRDIHDISMMEHYIQYDKHVIIKLEQEDNFASYTINFTANSVQWCGNVLVSAFDVVFNIYYFISGHFIHITMVSNLDSPDTYKFKMSFDVLNKSMPMMDTVLSYDIENVSNHNWNKNYNSYDWIAAYATSFTIVQSIKENHYVKIYIRKIK